MPHSHSQICWRGKVGWLLQIISAPLLTKKETQKTTRNVEPTLLAHCLYWLSPLNHKRTTRLFSATYILCNKKIGNKTIEVRPCGQGFYRFGFFRFGLETKIIGSVFSGSVSNLKLSVRFYSVRSIHQSFRLGLVFGLDNLWARAALCSNKLNYNQHSVIMKQVFGLELFVIRGH